MFFGVKRHRPRIEEGSRRFVLFDRAGATNVDRKCGMVGPADAKKTASGDEELRLR
jgi:hypothetical protein